MTVLFEDEVNKKEITLCQDIAPGQAYHFTEQIRDAPGGSYQVSEQKLYIVRPCLPDPNLRYPFARYD